MQAPDAAAMFGAMLRAKLRAEKVKRGEAVEEEEAPQQAELPFKSADKDGEEKEEETRSEELLASGIAQEPVVTELQQQVVAVEEEEDDEEELTDEEEEEEEEAEQDHIADESVAGSLGLAQDGPFQSAAAAHDEDDEPSTSLVLAAAGPGQQQQATPRKTAAARRSELNEALLALDPAFSPTPLLRPPQQVQVEAEEPPATALVLAPPAALGEDVAGHEETSKLREELAAAGRLAEALRAELGAVAEEASPVASSAAASSSGPPPTSASATGAVAAGGPTTPVARRGLWGMYASTVTQQGPQRSFGSGPQELARALLQGRRGCVAERVSSTVQVGPGTEASATSSSDASLARGAEASGSAPLALMDIEPSAREVPEPFEVVQARKRAARARDRAAEVVARLRSERAAALTNVATGPTPSVVEVQAKRDISQCEVVQQPKRRIQGKQTVSQVKCAEYTVTRPAECSPKIAREPESVEKSRRPPRATKGKPAVEEPMDDKLRKEAAAATIAGGGPSPPHGQRRSTPVRPAARGRAAPLTTPPCSKRLRT